MRLLPAAFLSPSPAAPTHIPARRLTTGSAKAAHTRPMDGAIDRVEDAVELLREAAARADNMGAPYESVRARRLLVAALLAAGQRGEATPVIAEAMADARQHGFHGEVELLGAFVGSET